MGKKIFPKKIFLDKVYCIFCLVKLPAVLYHCSMIQQVCIAEMLSIILSSPKIIIRVISLVDTDSIFRRQFVFG